jgi:hypothetical protein
LSWIGKATWKNTNCCWTENKFFMYRIFVFHVFYSVYFFN